MLQVAKNKFNLGQKVTISNDIGDESGDLEFLLSLKDKTLEIVDLKPYKGDFELIHYTCKDVLSGETIMGTDPNIPFPFIDADLQIKKIF